MDHRSVWQFVVARSDSPYSLTATSDQGHFFYCGDTDSWLDYRLFQDGIKIEELRCDSYVFGDLQRDGFVLSPKQLDDNDDWDIVLTLDEEWLVMFRSTLRTISAKELEREEIFHDLFLAQDAWMPDEDCIPYTYRQCTTKTLASSDFVRVDVLVRTYAQQVALSNASDVQGH